MSKASGSYLYRALKRDIKIHSTVISIDLEKK